MKTSIKILIFSIVLTAFSWISPAKSHAQASVSFQVFYDELSPHGTWINNAYGYVWIPNVPQGFTPYSTNGYWLYTESGWTWISSYSWGWAPFHYGRWYTDPFYGPMWIPGNEWGPGWVTWRSSGDYYGWAPIGPGISINVAYSNSYNVPSSQWTFVASNNFGSPNMSSHYINSSNNTTIINNTTVINNTNTTNNYHGGPRKSEVEKRTNKSISPVSVRESNKPGQSLGKDQLQIYKPQIQKTNSDGRKPVPGKITNLKDVKPAQKRSETPTQKNNQQPKQQPVKQEPRKQATENNFPQKKQTDLPKNTEKRQPVQPQKQQQQQQAPRQQKQSQQQQQPKQQPQQQQQQPRQQQQQQQQQQKQPQQQQQPKNNQPEKQNQQTNPPPQNGAEKKPH